MNCTGDQTMCLTLNGTWNGGGPQILKGCATPNVCHLQVNTTLGPEASGFRLVSQPECNYVVTPTLPGPPANTSLTTDGVTVCVTCSGLNTCDAVLCPADRNYCLQTAGILALGKGDSVVWRSGSCVALRDCLFGSSVSAFTSSVDFGFQINSTCCQGNCQALTPPEGVPASHPLSGFLCPTCPNGHPGPCNSSFYVQCPVGETECVQLDLLSTEGNIHVCTCMRVPVSKPECTGFGFGHCLGLGSLTYKTAVGIRGTWVARLMLSRLSSWVGGPPRARCWQREPAWDPPGRTYELSLSKINKLLKKTVVGIK
ncbi:uncharacterized protein LOC125915246 isoform X3 [Panthera uncia]|uniref:uncharacterized protein LOC125915246 isoform X3 n=1 Tax=Panthera uncia TaxID=29064 RepID=UPI0020FFE59D|nr:uncharacterized protein LOC125915246 isoform X3 [Panthera uncia]